jgi:colicin import membrane protein
VPVGLLLSTLCHVALLAWAIWSMRSIHELQSPDTPAISAEIITPSEFLRLKKGSEDAKHLETKANDKPTEDDSKNDTKKPDTATAPPPPPPPEQEVAKLEEPPPPEPPKPDEPDPIAKKLEEAPPPPPPAAGPTPEEKKALEEKLEAEKKAEQEKQKAEEEAKKKAEEEAKKKAEEEAKKKAAEKKRKAELARKKKLAEEKKRKEAEARKFDPNKLASLIDKAPDDGRPKALIDKDPRKKGQQAQGTSKTATDFGQEAGAATGTDTVLSAREQDLLKGMIKNQLARCWRLPGGGGAVGIPAVTLRWQLAPDGGLIGDPSVVNAPSDTLGGAAAEAALRAVRLCQPFHLPPESYAGWKDIEWTFDPRQML